MASCAYCDSFILFGGAADESGRYCNSNCQQAGHLMLISRNIPEWELDALIQQVHLGTCPRCQGKGPVDLHKAHKVWSAFVVTSWSSSPEISCKSCAVKRQVGAALFSGVFGWWGIPWGLIMTPFQVIRNIIEMAGGPRPGAPSPLLKSYVRMQAAAHYAASQPPPMPGGPPPLPQEYRPVASPSDLWVPGDDRRYQPPGR